MWKDRRGVGSLVNIFLEGELVDGNIKADRFPTSEGLGERGVSPAEHCDSVKTTDRARRVR